MIAIIFYRTKITWKLNNTVKLRPLHLFTCVIHIFNVFNFENRILRIFFGIFNETFGKFRLRIVDNCNIKTGRIITENRPEH